MVKAMPLCVPDMTLGTDLWSENFEVVHLDEIMRQKDDLAFTNLPNKLRTKKKGTSLTELDIAPLQRRSDLSDEPEDALHVFAVINNVDVHNDMMLRRTCDELVNISAKDGIKDKASGKYHDLAMPQDGSNDDLPGQLILGVGARVILVQNIDVTIGLVNGALQLHILILMQKTPCKWSMLDVIT